MRYVAGNRQHFKPSITRYVATIQIATVHVNVNLDGLGDAPVLQITDITGQWWIRTELLA
jgi:hypothetical protein